MDAKTLELTDKLREVAAEMGWTIEDIDEYDNAVIVTFEKD